MDMEAHMKCLMKEQKKATPEALPDEDDENNEENDEEDDEENEEDEGSSEDHSSEDDEPQETQSPSTPNDDGDEGEGSEEDEDEESEESEESGSENVSEQLEMLFDEEVAKGKEKPEVPPQSNVPEEPKEEKPGKKVEAAVKEQESKFANATSAMAL